MKPVIDTAGSDVAAGTGIAERIPAVAAVRGPHWFGLLAPERKSPR